MHKTTLYVRLDGDDIGQAIELSLLNDDSIAAQNHHHNVQNAIAAITENVKSNESCSILLRGCDDLLFTITEEAFSMEFLKSLQVDFQSKSGFTLSIGVGKALLSCLQNLQVAKLSGKNRIVFR